MGEMLAVVLDRFAHRSSEANDQLEMMRAQNAAQRAEIKALTERMRRLEALQLPAPLAPQLYADRHTQAPPLTHQMRSAHVNRPHAEEAVIEDGRVIKMRTGGRPRQLWTGPGANSAHDVRSALENSGPERAYTHTPLPLQRPRRPASPKPPPARRPRFPMIDAPPLPHGRGVGPLPLSSKTY